jgi:hypothetical protein
MLARAEVVVGKDDDPEGLGGVEPLRVIASTWR